MDGTALSALVFDTFGTVVDWRGSLIAELTAFGRERGIAADWTGLVDAWRGRLCALDGSGAPGRAALDQAR